MWEAYSETDTRFPQLGTGGAPTGGPRYDFDPDLDSPTKFPEFYDGRWFIGEWNNGWIKTATLGDDGAATGVQCWVACNNSFPGGGYLRPMDMEFGPDGSLYVIEWGSGFGGNNPDSGIYRIDYTQGDRRPVAHAAATPDSGPTPLEVQFSSDGSNDPEGTEITYEWDFDGDGTTDSTDPNPSHTYATAGNFSAKLTVTDAGGLKGTDSVPIVAGNSRPEVTIDIPEDGKIADFGDIVPFHITVSDAEDGSTTDGGIDCDDVTLNVSLGHDQHAHELSQQQGCEGTFETGTDGGHGAEANIFTVIEATYTDSGGTGVGATTGRAQAILQPKLKQAEYYANTGRVPGTDSTGDAGVQKEATTDTGGGQADAFIEDGDWISFTPYNLEDLSTVSFRVASAGAGGRIELRSGAADGPLVATADVAPTGGWQNWTTVSADLHDVPDGTHDLFIVFRNDTDNGSLMNLNWFRLDGKGAGISAPPVVSATATPATGEAPLEVAFDSTAVDPEGDAMTYAWDFGVPGTGTDVSTEADPTYTYTRGGTFTAKVTVTDANGAKGTATVPVTVTGGDQCPTGGLVDDFDGTQLGAAWTVIRPDQTMGVSGGTLNIPAQPGDIYADRNDAKNLVTRAAPDGAWTAVAKLDYEGTTQYHQAGIMVYGDDDNFTKFGRLATDADGNGDEKFEFILRERREPAQRGGRLDRQPAGRLPEGLLGPAGLRRHERDRRVLDRRRHVDHRRAPGAAARGREARPVRVQQRRHRQPGREVRLVHAERRGHGRRRRHAVRPELRRRVRRLEPGHRPLERDRPPGRRAHERRGREADADHLAGRHLHRRHQRRPRATSSSSPRTTRARTGRSRPRSTGRRSTAGTGRAACSPTSTATTT